MQVIRTLLADNHRIFLEGLKSVLESDPDHQYEIVGCTPNGQRLLELWREHRPDLMIMDLNLLEKHGLEAIDAIRKAEKVQQTHILVITACQDIKVLRAALDYGANGYLPKYKDAADLYEAIQSIMSGKVYRSEPVKNSMGKPISETSTGGKAMITEVFVKKHRLTKRETQILSLISQAMSNKEIGRKLFISDQTVSVHRKNIMRKLGVRSTAGLMKMTYEHSL